MGKSEVTKEIDARTNQPVPRLEWKVETPDDYKRLREAFTKIPPTPVLVHVDEVESEEGYGRKYNWLLRPEQSAGQIALHLLTLYPGFHVTDHNHVSEGEYFYVIEGEVELTIGNQQRIAGPGTFGYAPPMATHAFKPIGDKPAVLLHWNVPGGHERLPEAMVQLIKSGKDAPEARKRLQVTHEYIFHD